MVRYSDELIEEMTQYDIGLVLLNVTNRNRRFLETTFPNKLYEYLYAGLPIACENLNVFRDFIKKYAVGEIVDFSSHLHEQMRRVSQIKIEENYLENNNLVMDLQANKIIEFYNEVGKV